MALMVLSHAAAQTPASRPVKALEIPVRHYVVSELSLHQALKLLVGQRDRTFVIGFEHVPEAEPFQEGPMVAASIENGTVQDALRELCAGDPRYTFTDAGDGVINVYPVMEEQEQRALFGLFLVKVDIETDDWPQNPSARQGLRVVGV